MSRLIWYPGYELPLNDIVRQKIVTSLTLRGRDMSIWNPAYGVHPLGMEILEYSI